MDYPQDESIGLVNGKFVDENEVTAQVGSLIPASWANGLTDEMINIIEAAGLTPDEGTLTQVLAALQAMFAKLNGAVANVFSVAPATKGEHAMQLAQVQAIPSSIQSVSAAVAANALTLKWQPQPLVFRNAALSNGAPVAALAPGAALSITVPTGATLGTFAGQQATLVLLVAYNAGVPVLCVANISGGLDFSETGVISPTTISAAATSAGVIYSASAVAAGSAYRVVGYVQVTEAVAGTWATAPSTVQGSGGQALASLQSLGFGQAWQNVTASRAYGTTYYNTTARPILVMLEANPNNSSNSQAVSIYVNGVLVTVLSTTLAAAQGNASFIVPPGGSYQAASNGYSTIAQWAELR